MLSPEYKNSGFKRDYRREVPQSLDLFTSPFSFFFNNFAVFLGCRKFRALQKIPTKWHPRDLLIALFKNDERAVLINGG